MPKKNESHWQVPVNAEQCPRRRLRGEHRSRRGAPLERARSDGEERLHQPMRERDQCSAPGQRRWRILDLHECRACDGNLGQRAGNRCAPSNFRDRRLCVLNLRSLIRQRHESRAMARGGHARSLCRASLSRCAAAASTTTLRGSRIEFGTAAESRRGPWAEEPDVPVRAEAQRARTAGEHRERQHRPQQRGSQQRPSPIHNFANGRQIHTVGCGTRI